MEQKLENKQVNLNFEYQLLKLAKFFKTFSWMTPSKHTVNWSLPRPILPLTHQVWEAYMLNVKKEFTFIVSEIILGHVKM